MPSAADIESAFKQDVDGLIDRFSAVINSQFGARTDVDRIVLWAAVNLIGVVYQRAKLDRREDVRSGIEAALAEMLDAVDVHQATVRPQPQLARRVN